MKRKKKKATHLFCRPSAAGEENARGKRGSRLTGGRPRKKKEVLGKKKRDVYANSHSKRSLGRKKSSRRRKKKEIIAFIGRGGGGKREELGLVVRKKELTSRLNGGGFPIGRRKERPRKLQSGVHSLLNR